MVERYRLSGCSFDYEMIKIPLLWGIGGLSKSGLAYRGYVLHFLFKRLVIAADGSALQNGMFARSDLRCASDPPVKLAIGVVNRHGSWQ